MRYIYARSISFKCPCGDYLGRHKKHSASFSLLPSAAGTVNLTEYKIVGFMFLLHHEEDNHVLHVLSLYLALILVYLMTLSPSVSNRHWSQTVPPAGLHTGRCSSS